MQKTDKILLVLIILTIIVSIVGTILVINATNIDEPEMTRGSAASGTLTLSIAEEPQEYATSGSISLKVES